MNIDFQVPSTGITVNGKHYKMAERTLAICKKLEKVEIDMRKREEPEYKIQLAQIEVLLGKDARREIFGAEDDLNLDFLEVVYAGCIAEFTEASRRANEAMKGKPDPELNAQLQNLNTLIQSLLEVNRATAGANHIRRGE